MNDLLMVVRIPSGYGGFLTRVTQRVLLVEQELPTISKHLCSSRLSMGLVLLNL